MAARAILPGRARIGAQPVDEPGILGMHGGGQTGGGHGLQRPEIVARVGAADPVELALAPDRGAGAEALEGARARVGEGPFPTELFDHDGEELRRIGSEFGATTGRPRRCGWFDALLVEQAVKINGFTDIFLTKLDILSGWEKIPVCVAYEVDGVRHDVMPMTHSDFHHAKPIYEELDGWTEDISGCRTFDELPATCQAYVHRLEELIGCRISGIGVGPGREQSVAINDLI